MNRLSDRTLVDAYYKALEMKLNASYLELVREELTRRGIELQGDESYKYVNR